MFLGELIIHPGQILGARNPDPRIWARLGKSRDGRVPHGVKNDTAAAGVIQSPPYDAI
jgi:hypothetical protein